MRVLAKYYGWQEGKARRMKHRLKLLDPMVRIAQMLDIRFQSLNDLLLHNALATKTASGLEAIRMWEEGRREELEQYCAYDVEALAQLIFLPALKVYGHGTVPNAVYGIASFLSCQRAMGPVSVEDDWTLVEAF